jgi:transposase-like protein
MGKQKTYSWEFKVHMVHLLAKGTHNMSQMSRDYHVTRSLLYAWMQLYQERGEAAFIPDHAIDMPPEVERPHTAEEQVAHLERLCGQQALELDVLREEVDVLKKAWHQLPSNSGMR